MSFSLTPITIVPRKASRENDFFIQISEQLFTKLQLNENQPLHVTLGQKNITLMVQIEAGAKNDIYLTETTLKDLCLPIQTYRFQAIYLAKNQELIVGPVIGLLTDFPANKDKAPHFRSIHTFCEELHHEITEQGGFFYVFSYDQFPNNGYFFKNGEWMAAQLPLPNVIYNRIHSRRLEKQESFLRFRNKLEELMIPLFNDRFLSKWEIYEQIKEESKLSPFIPDTNFFSKAHLNEFILNYQTTFLKPIHGSQGRNIIKIINEGKHYTIQSSVSNQLEPSQNHYSYEEIFKLIKPMLQNRMYIIQQGIPLITHQACAMDFRILCHKTKKDQWKVTSTVARIAAEQEFVSNIARGGTVTRPLAALQTSMNRKNAVEVLALMKELALESAAAISRHSAGLFGELGIDIGVDITGKPWLIEVNSKPSKNFEHNEGKIRPSAKAIIQCCTELSFDFTLIKEAP